MTVIDDDDCTDGAVKISRENDEGFNLPVCECIDGYFINKSSSSFCDSATSCLKCADGMICEESQVLVLLCCARRHESQNSA